MIKLIASDLDGTIINSQNDIPKENINAIKKISNSPAYFAICTGKTYSMVKDTCKELSANYGIFGNGTQIIDLSTGKEIASNILNKDEVMYCINVANKNNLHLHIYIDNKIIVEKELKYMALRNYKLYNSQVDFEIVESLTDYIEKYKPSILKLVLTGVKDLTILKKEIQDIADLTVTQIKKYDKYKDEIINQEYEYLDIVPKNVTKSQALNHLSDYLEISKQEIMSVGDNINDIEMIKDSGIGVAIGGSYEEVTKMASYVTKNDVCNAGFAEAVYKFIDFN